MDKWIEWHEYDKKLKNNRWSKYQYEKYEIQKKSYSKRKFTETPKFSAGINEYFYYRF